MKKELNIDLLKIAANPIGYVIESVVKEAIETFSDSSDKSTSQELKEMAFREEIKASVLQSQAKIEQELAIARRIDSAEEVEIEEFFNTDNSSKLGLDVSDSKAIFGYSADNYRVTKRVIKFKGCRYIQDIEKSKHLDKSVEK